MDEDRYTRRFSPRKPRSIWSATNIKRAGELDGVGPDARARPRGVRGPRSRRANLYSYENKPQEFAGSYEKTFRANTRAWTFFQSLPAGYRRVATWWVMSAKQEATRARRLAKLIAVSEDEIRLGHLDPAKYARQK